MTWPEWERYDEQPNRLKCVPKLLLLLLLLTQKLGSCISLFMWGPNRPTDQKQPADSPVTFIQKKELQKQKLNLFSQQIQIKIIFYGLDWKISNKKEKTTNLGQCQHRMPECSLEIIILCSLLELWSTKHTQRTHPYMKRWTIQEMRDKRATTKTTKI